MAISKEMKESARLEYFKGVDPNEISLNLNINYYTLISWITKGSKGEPPWAEERQALESGKVAEAILDHTSDMEEVVSLGFKVLLRGMNYLHESCTNVDLRDAERITKMIDTMQKWSERDSKYGNSEPTSQKTAKLSDQPAKTHVDHPFLKKKAD